MIVVPEDYPFKKLLEKHGVVCISEAKAMKADIRALRIGVLNIMPKAETYEFNILHPLGRFIIQIEPIWIRLKNHNYSSTDKNHLEKLYVSFEDAISKQHLDGLIVTGAPVEEYPFEEVTYWNEITEILTYARKNIASTLGICWGGLAIAKFLGIDKVALPQKLFGVFEVKNLNKENHITSEMDDLFWCPQSRLSGLTDESMERAAKNKTVELLGYNRDAGYTLFESCDKRFLVHLGHPEYHSHRIVEEYQRDMAANKTNVPYPANFDINFPINRWKSHRYELFDQWIRFIHETTPW